MDIKDLILNKFNKKDVLKVSDIVKETGFSRAYISRIFKELRENGEVLMIGNNKNARYIKADKKNKDVIIKVPKLKRTFKNKDLNEDIVFNSINQTSGLLLGVEKRLQDIFNYAFTEIFNNAIDHSSSDDISIEIEKDKKFKFIIRDWGVGIFNNIMQKKNLDNQLDAIQDLLKGKSTTDPKRHSGEGIFFTSKVADIFIIESFSKRLIINNKLDDVFIENIKEKKGTRVVFSIDVKSQKDLLEIFRKYTDKNLEFTKTSVKVELYKLEADYISRSQGKRIMYGLEKFKSIILDFKNIETVGQAFADEVFRVWRSGHPDIKIDFINANENVRFMIERV